MTYDRETLVAPWNSEFPTYREWYATFRRAAFALNGNPDRLPMPPHEALYQSWLRSVSPYCEVLAWFEPRTDA